MKRLSLRTKVFAWSILQILMFLLFSSLLSAFLFKPYYILRHKIEMKESCELISHMYEDSKAQLDLTIERIERLSSFTVEVYSKEGKIEYMTEQWKPRDSYGRTPEPLPPPAIRGSESPAMPIPPFSFYEFSHSLQGSEYQYRQHMDERFKARILHIFYKMEDGGLIHLNQPLEPIEQSVVIAVKFSFLSALITLCIAAFISYFFARYITSPINELTSIAHDMACLNFTQKYDSSRKDEIGDLGRSLNSLSDQLNRSIRELNRMNLSLRDEVENKRRVDVMRREFIASVSHELRTPLALIKGYAEGLQDDVGEGTESREYYCDVILDETQKMEKQVSSLLNLSQLQSGAVSLENSEFDMVGLILKVAEKYRMIFLEKKISFSFHYAASVMACADIYRTEQILINYINNAVNHISGRREISIILGRTEDNKLRVGVSNSGPGIPEDSLEKIWDSYYKVDKARTRSYGGTGLGLSIVKAIQEQYGCAFGAENRRDGVVFWFDLNPA